MVSGNPQRLAGCVCPSEEEASENLGDGLIRFLEKGESERNVSVGLEGHVATQVRFQFGLECSTVPGGESLMKRRL